MLDFNDVIDAFRRKLGFTGAGGKSARYPAGFLVARVARHINSAIDPDPDNVVKPLLEHFSREFDVNAGSQLTKSGAAGASLRKLGTAHGLYRLFEHRKDFLDRWPLTLTRAIGVVASVGRIREQLPLGDTNRIRLLLQRVRDDEDAYPDLIEAAEMCGRRVNRASLERFRFSLAAWSYWAETATQAEQLRTLYSELNHAIKLFGGEAVSESQILGEQHDSAWLTWTDFDDWDSDVAPPLLGKVSYEPDAGIDSERWVEEGLAPGELSSVTRATVGRLLPELPRYLQEVAQSRAFYLRLSRPFNVLDGRCLTATESRALVSELLNCARDAELELPEREAALMVLLQIGSAWSYSTISKCRWTGHQDCPGTLTEDGYFVQPVPGFQRFCKWEGPVKSAGQTRLCLPAPLIKVLLAVSPYRAGQRVFRTRVETLKKVVAGLFLRLRQANSRVRADRVAETIPTFIYEHTQDLRMVQLVCGSNFGLSPWPLFYYAEWNSRLQRAHKAAVGRVFGWNAWTDTRGDDFRVGSRLGANFQTARRVVSHLEAAVQACERRGRGNGRRSFASWMKYLDALSRKTAFMVGAPLGYRNFDSIGELTILDFNLHAGADSMVAGEKGADSAHLGYRVASLGTQMVAQQIDVLLAVYQKVSTLAVSGVVQEAVKQAVRRAISGEGPIFLSFGRDGVTPATHSWLKAGIPEQSIPANIFRHIVASSWCECGGKSRDLFSQLGHAGYADHRFSPTSLDYPLAFLRRVQPVVERIMRKLGWATSVIDKNQASTVLSERFHQQPRVIRLLDERRRDATTSGVDAAGVEFLRLSRECIAIKLEAHLSSGTEDWAPFESGCLQDIIELKKSLRIKVSMAELRSICKQTIESLRDESVEVVTRCPDDEKFITPDQMTAWQVVCRLRAAKSQADTKSKSKLSPQASLALDLLLGRFFRDPQHFFDVFHAVENGRLLVEPNRVLEVSLSSETQTSVEWLSPLLAAQLARNAAAPRNEMALEEELLIFLQGLGLCGVGSQKSIGWLVKIGQMCARLEWPGLCVSAQMDAGFQSPLSLERAEDWRRNQFGNGQGWPELMDDHDGPATRTRTMLGDVPWEDVARRVSELIEGARPGNDQAMRVFRGAIRDLESEVLASEEASVEAKVLVCFTAMISSGGEKRGGGTLALGTVAKYSNIALTALRWMASPYIETPQEAFEMVLGQSENASKRLHSSSYQRSKIESLKRLNALMASKFGFEPAEPHIWGYGKGYKSAARAEIISPLEYQKAVRVLVEWSYEGGHSRHLFSAAIVSLMLMYEAGLRPEEPIGLMVGDLIHCDGEIEYLVIRSNALRRTKNRGRQRLVCLSEMSSDLRYALSQVLADLRRDGAGSISANTPLLVSANRYAEESDCIGTLVTQALRVATGSKRARRYSCRHSYVNRKVVSILASGSPVGWSVGAEGSPKALTDLSDVSVRVGHIAELTTARHYIHIGHRALGLFHPKGSQISKAEMAVYEGASLPNRRRHARKVAARMLHA